MSADAKIWHTGLTGWSGWNGSHDSEQWPSCGAHRDVTLHECIAAVEKCLGQSLRWEFGGTPETPILKGYLA